MIDIVTLIVNHLLNDMDLVEDEKEIIENLMLAGYDLKEIQAAYSWVQNIAFTCKPDIKPKQVSTKSSSFRVLSHEENYYFTPEAFGFLIKLHDFGIIDDFLREEIIERAMLLSSDEIGLEEIKLVTILMLFDYSKIDSKHQVVGLLDDNWEQWMN